MLKKEILRGNKNFQLIYKRGQSVGDRYIVFFYRKNGLDYDRKAFLASKKVGKSVQRNRARRLMKESFRQIESSSNVHNVGYDYIFIARNTINGVKKEDVRKSMLSAINRSKLGKKS